MNNLFFTITAVINAIIINLWLGMSDFMTALAVTVFGSIIFLPIVALEMLIVNGIISLFYKDIEFPCTDL